MIVVTGGDRSGKSDFAEQLAIERGKIVLYIATAIPFDTEMEERIAKHQQRRPAHWDTLEQYTHLAEVIQKQSAVYDCILLDCVTILLTNLLFQFSDTEDVEKMDFVMLEEQLIQEIDSIGKSAKNCDSEVIFVTGEVGLGIVPADKLSRHFRDILGRANQCLAAYAEKVYFVISGIPMQIKG